MSAVTARTLSRKRGIQRATSLLILSSKAGSMTPEIKAKLRKAFQGSLIVEFDPKMDVEKVVGPNAMIVVAGGDGTIDGDIVKRVLARAVLSKHKKEGLGQVFKFRKLEVVTKPKVRIYADNAQLGRTPATITAELSALQLILPR